MSRSNGCSPPRPARRRPAGARPARNQASGGRNHPPACPNPPRSHRPTARSTARQDPPRPPPRCWTRRSAPNRDDTWASSAVRRVCRQDRERSMPRLRLLLMTDTATEITADLIAELLREQHPDLAGLPLTLGARGWDNQLWRLGDDLAVRLPWATQDADELLLKEHTLLPAVAPRLPLQIAVPQRLGQPSERCPRPWIVTTWLAGEPADRAPATSGAEAADTLAAFLAALHQPAPDDAPAGRNRRGGPLAGIREGFARLLKET